MTLSSVSSTFSISIRSGLFAMNPVSHSPAANSGWFSTFSMKARLVLTPLMEVSLKARIALILAFSKVLPNAVTLTSKES